MGECGVIGGGCEIVLVLVVVLVLDSLRSGVIAATRPGVAIEHSTDGTYGTNVTRVIG